MTSPPCEGCRDQVREDLLKEVHDAIQAKSEAAAAHDAVAMKLEQGCGRSPTSAPKLRH